MLVVILPKMSVSQVVRVLKVNTSRDLKKKFPFLKKVYWGTDGIWSDGYFAQQWGSMRQSFGGKEDLGQAQLVLGTTKIPRV